MTCKIIAFAGSTREQSYNKMLVKIALEGAEKAGANVQFVDLRDYPMPFYDEDLEGKEGIPKKAKEFKEILKASDGFLIASPEYNSMFSGVLKNAIDWASRPEPDEGRLVAFSGKFAGIMSATPGSLGGIRGLPVLRTLLNNIGVNVVTSQYALSSAHKSFDESGNLTDAKKAQTIRSIGEEVVKYANALKL